VKSAAVILSAGESRRMGSPKALLEYRGETFLDRLTRVFTLHCDPVIVVLGAAAADVRAGFKGSACIVVNDGWRTGQTSSMQCGLRAVPPNSAGVLFTLVDHPAVAPETVEALLSGSGRLRVPRFDGRRGHPIWFSRDLIAEFLALPVSGVARDVVRSHAAETEFLDVNDPGILADIDDPAGYRSLIGAEA
jgi:CTP:molybdopterin cytidylyltransferase MocA